MAGFSRYRHKAPAGRRFLQARNGEFALRFGNGAPNGLLSNAAFDPSGRLGFVIAEAEQGLLLSLPEAGAGARLIG